jgi:hypothetical protein
MVMLMGAMSITVAVAWLVTSTMYMQWLRSSARAVAEHVVAFRSWVAGPGAVWVNGLQPTAPDFLEQKLCNDDTRFYSKNPALATRELSDMIAKTAVNATFRVVSDNYRNPLNAPDAYESSALRRIKSSMINPPSDRVDFVEKIEGSTYRYSIPIRVSDSCLACHGSAKDAPRAVVEKYGSYRAFGYKVGDIRGIITVNLPMPPLFAISPQILIISLGALGLVILVNWRMFRRLISDRIEESTELTQSMTQGNYDVDVPQGPKSASNDEIDSLNRSLDLLRKNLKNAAKH